LDTLISKMVIRSDEFFKIEASLFAGIAELIMGS